MDSLTKENFWNDLYSKYPGDMQIFCDWIDEYKKRVDWKILFNSYVSCGKWGGCEGHEPDAPKYHDLPKAFQIGIFMQFVAEKKQSSFRYGLEMSIEHQSDWDNIQQVIIDFFFHEWDDVRNQKYQQ